MLVASLKSLSKNYFVLGSKMCSKISSISLKWPISIILSASSTIRYFRCLKLKAFYPRSSWSLPGVPIIICGFFYLNTRNCFSLDIPPMMQVTFICSFGSLPSFTVVRAIEILASICWASSCVGVRTSPKIHWGRDGIPKSCLILSSSERMGAAKARVFPDPVWAATRKS